MLGKKLRCVDNISSISRLNTIDELPSVEEELAVRLKIAMVIAQLISFFSGINKAPGAKRVIDSH